MDSHSESTIYKPVVQNESVIVRDETQTSLLSEVNTSDGIEMGLNELRALSIVGEDRVGEHDREKKRSRYVEDDEEPHCSRDDRHHPALTRTQQTARERAGQIIKDAERSRAHIFEVSGTKGNIK